MRILSRVGDVIAFTTGKTIREVIGPADEYAGPSLDCRIRTEFTDGTALEMHIERERGYGSEYTPPDPASVWWFALEPTDQRK